MAEVCTPETKTCTHGWLEYWLNRYQTLLGALIAIAAAALAARAAWRQLAKMEVQSAVMARDVLSKRLVDLEARKRETKKILTEVGSDFLLQINPDLDENAPQIGSEWAHGAEQKVDLFCNRLQLDQQRKNDPAEIDAIRSTTIERARELSSCLGAVHRPDSAPWDDPEYNLTKDDQLAAIKEAEKARRKMTETILDLMHSGEKLDQAFAVELEKLRTRIREIDAIVVEHELTRR